MKSLADVAVVIATAVLTTVALFSINVGYQSQNVARENNERGIIEGINQMESAKSSVEHSLDYSTYQGAYDTLNYGQYSISNCNPQTASDGIPFWRTVDTTCIPTSLETDLSNKINSYFNQYFSVLSSELSKIQITFPPYTLTTTINPLKVQANSNNQILFKSNNLEIKDNANTNLQFNIPVKDFIDKAKQTFVDNDPVKNQMISVSNQVLASCKTLQNIQTFTGPSCKSQSEVTLFTKSQILDKYCPNIMNQFSNSIVNGINGLTGQFDTGTLHVTVQTILNFVKTSVDTDNENTCNTNPSCSCAQSVTYQCGTADKPQTCSRCVLYQTSFTKTCAYNYQSSADAFIRIGTKDNAKYPVYDKVSKITDTKPIKLQFWDRTQLGSLSLNSPDSSLLPAESSSTSLPVATLPSVSFIWPLDTSGTTLTSCIGPRPALGDIHTGIDISKPMDSSVRAVANGRVEDTCVYSPFDWGIYNIARALLDDRVNEYTSSQLFDTLSIGHCGSPGQRVLIQNNDGYETLYIHLNQVLVNSGDTIQQGQVIGTVGTTGVSTGPHLHFQICSAGQPYTVNGRAVSSWPCTLPRIVNVCNTLDCSSIPINWNIIDPTNAQYCVPS